ncbi:MAG: hypothetical protein LBL67_04595 [Coriobacteriales bacterium]|jgi:hypothetical protein|nr:hypothetical protein [Coriobacteriales bacterium]
MQRQSNKGARLGAVLLALLLALASLGLVGWPKAAYAADTLTVNVTIPSTATANAAADVKLNLYNSAGQVPSGDAQSLGFSQGVTTGTETFNITTSGLYILTGQLTDTGGNALAYGMQSLIIPAYDASSGADVSLTFTGYDAASSSGTPSGSTTLMANIAETLTLSGGDPMINFGDVKMGTNPTVKGSTPLKVVSSVPLGYELEAQTTTTNGEMGLNGQTNTTAGQYIPWGDATGVSNVAWHVMMTANPQNSSDTGLVQHPFTSLSDSSGNGPTHGTPAVVADSFGLSQPTTGGDLYTPEYGLSLNQGLEAGTYATTITYTLSAASA